jgi:hypothetical protein
MFSYPRTPTPLRKQINVVLNDMMLHEPTSEEYATLLDRLKVLHKMEEESKPSRVSPDTVVLAVTNILGIAMIIRHEHLNVVTSKALSLVRPPK